MKEREGEREKEAERDAESAARGVKAKEMESSWTQDSKKENIEWGEHLHMYEETYFLYSIVLTTISQARDIVVSTIYYNQLVCIDSANSLVPENSFRPVFCL